MNEYEHDLVETRTLSRLIILIAERARADFANAIAPFDLPVPVARALFFLSEPTSMKDLAEYLACDPSYITSIADEMETRDLITRVPGKDRRVKLLQLTQKGVAVREEAALAVRSRVGFAHQLDAGEREALRRLLERMLQDE